MIIMAIPQILQHILKAFLWCFFLIFPSNNKGTTSHTIKPITTLITIVFVLKEAGDVSHQPLINV